MCLQEFVNPFCEESENAFFQPNPSISEKAVNLRLKLKTNVSFRLLFCVLPYLRKLNLPWASEGEKRVSSRSCVLIFQSEWERTLYWEISASKTKTEQPNRTAFNVCVQLTKLNWCVFAGVCKPFLWRSRKRIFPAKSKHFRNSCKSPSKLKTNVSFRLLFCVFAYLRELNLPWDSEGEKRLSCKSCVLILPSEWEQTLYWEISASETKTEQPTRTAFNVCVQLTELNWCVFAGVCKHFLWRIRKRIFPAKSKHFRNRCKSPSKTQNERILQTALLCVRLPTGVESALRFREWEARFF